MNLHTFRGPDLQRLLDAARRALGDDALVLQTRPFQMGSTRVLEVVAARAEELERFRARLEPEPLVLPIARRKGERPRVFALVGPTGAGKTTTAAKLAVHPEAFGGRKVGVLTLDTYRVGALEQLEIVAEVARLPLEVAYSVGEVEAALRRLSSCDVVIIDTPGRSPKAAGANEEWRALLFAARPDETHLVLPATMRLDIAESVYAAHEALGITHLLLSKLDEVPGEAGVADVALRVRLPARWLTDGQEIPADLRSAPARILSTLGLRPEEAA